MNSLAKQGQKIYNQGMEQSQLITDVQQLIESLGQFPEPVMKPSLVVVTGLPGTGKSYFCRQLAQKLETVILESDALRKSLFPGQAIAQPRVCAYSECVTSSLKHS